MILFFDRVEKEYLTALTSLLEACIILNLAAINAIFA